MNERVSGVSQAEADRNTDYGRYLYYSCVVIALQIGVLLLLDRQWFCSCGSLRVWQGTLDPAQNSQHLTDPYSFLHLAFGAALFVWLQAIRPRWHVARRATYAVASSAIWETFENLPFIINMFGTAGSDLHYSGDSIVNSLADTSFVTLGFAVASRLPTGLTVAAMLAMEVTTFVMIGDGIVAGLLRLTMNL